MQKIQQSVPAKDKRHKSHAGEFQKRVRFFWCRCPASRWPSHLQLQLYSFYSRTPENPVMQANTLLEELVVLRRLSPATRETGLTIKHKKVETYANGRVSASLWSTRNELLGTFVRAVPELLQLSYARNEVHSGLHVVCCTIHDPRLPEDQHAASSTNQFTHATSNRQGNLVTNPSMHPTTPSISTSRMYTKTERSTSTNPTTASTQRDRHANTRSRVSTPIRSMRSSVPLMLALLFFSSVDCSDTTARLYAIPGNLALACKSSA